MKRKKVRIQSKKSKFRKKIFEKNSQISTIKVRFLFPFPLILLLIPPTRRIISQSLLCFSSQRHEGNDSWREIRGCVFSHQTWAAHLVVTAKQITMESRSRCFVKVWPDITAAALWTIITACECKWMVAENHSSVCRTTTVSSQTFRRG